MITVKQLKDSLDYIKSFGHEVIPLRNGDYYIRWVSYECVEVNAEQLVEIANEIYQKENNGSNKRTIKCLG